jgi:predicted dehydrogenase
VSDSREIGVGVIGLGFMGRTHLAAYQAAAQAGFSNRLVAVSDPHAERRAGRFGEGGNLSTGQAAFDPAEVHAYADPGELLADPAVDLVSICTPTDSHVALAIAALEAGKHVLVEKPVATELREVGRLAAVAERSTTLCMPAMCIRFWPGYTWLAARIADGRHGRLRGLTLTRLGTRPDWNRAFYDDPSRSGGALFDLHVHDADFAFHCLGAPRAVSAAGDRSHVRSVWHYEVGPDGGPPPAVALEGGWDHDQAFPFRMRFRAEFERATAEFELSQGARLLLHEQGATRELELAPHDGYSGEVRALLAAICGDAFDPPADVHQAAAVTRLLEATAESCERGASVSV